MKCTSRLLFVLAIASGGHADAQQPADAMSVTDEAAPASAPDGAAPTATPAQPAAVDTRTAREKYNDGLRQFEAATFDAAAATFLAARDDAGPDPELRFRAAYNLGIAYAKSVDAVVADPAADPAAAPDADPAADPAAAPDAAPDAAPAAKSPQAQIDLLRQAAAWFQDAVRLRPEEEDARVNLEVVLRRIQILADQLNQGQNSLEARLDRVIDDQRTLRDEIRQLMSRIVESGQAADPIGFEGEFERLATSERTLGADAGTISDLAGAERGLIDGKQATERTDEEKGRAVQLGNLDLYLQRGRQSLSDARRQLRRLRGDGAHRRADAALAELKRAREQLLEPIAVLKGIVEDETVLTIHTEGLSELRKGTIRPRADQPPAAPPPWLTSEHLIERQAILGLRTGEVAARFTAGIGAADAEPAATATADGAGGEVDPKQRRAIESARAALPHLEAAVASMQNAEGRIGDDKLVDGLAEERAAIESLVAAIERFAGVRDLIEIAHADQTQVVNFVTPDGERTDLDPGQQPESLSVAERSRRIRAAIARNRDRMARLTDLLTEEEAELLAGRPTEPADPAGGPATPPAPPTEAEQKAIRERYEQAEELRSAADAALADAARELARLDPAPAAAVRPLRDAARAAMTQIEALRRLFFTIVEHLKELHGKQTETHDQTASAQSADQLARDTAVGPLAEYQARHASIADTLALALGEQADAAGASSDPQAQGGAEALAQAMTEVRGASGAMVDASGMLDEAVDRIGQETDLEPALEHQLEALEHLEKAIQILDPRSQQPQPQPGEKGDDGEQQQQQEQEPQPGENEQLSQRQAERRLQAIRDREADRQRQRQEQALTPPEPVEKDW